MPRHDAFLIDGAWVGARGSRRRIVVDPATEQAIAEVAMASAADVDAAVAAARRAFETWSGTSPRERIDLLDRVIDRYDAAAEDLATAMTAEMGSPLAFSRTAQFGSGRAHLRTAAAILEDFRFEDRDDGVLLTKLPIGVCALITPWNWPMNQLLVKIAPALAAGCTVVVKPSEFSPLSALRLAEAMREAGLPAGVFNLVNGDAEAGEALADHPDVDMVSFTGSHAAGVAVARAAAGTIKRVHQELGGKSAFIVLDDADLETAVRACVAGCFVNSGQSCAAPTRLLVPRRVVGRAQEIAREAAASAVVGPPLAAGTELGPLVNARQFDRVQAMIAAGRSEGARLVAGGPGRPAGLERGYYTRPTVFSGVEPGMGIAMEEIFGPVLSIIAHDGDEDAAQLANRSVYGLAAYVRAADLDRANRVARALRVGTVYVNDGGWNPTIPVGGFKRSGNGREHGRAGLESFLELRAIAT